jgi:hypothetical protein
MVLERDETELGEPQAKAKVLLELDRRYFQLHFQQ